MNATIKPIWRGVTKRFRRKLINLQLSIKSLQRKRNGFAKGSKRDGLATKVVCARALEQLRRERAARRERQQTADLTLIDASKSGRLVIEAEGLGLTLGDNKLFEDFATTVLRGDRIGVIGRNGVGKSTLIKTLLGQIEPTEGTSKLGTNLEIALFDQLRETLDDDASVIDNLQHGSDFVEVGDGKKHVIGYLQDFYFHQIVRVDQPECCLAENAIDSYLRVSF